jgi:phosphoribosylformylglycinamidine cyclo-ligase
VIFRASWPVPEVFTEMRKRGVVSEGEMFRTFNMGLGLVLAVERGKAEALRKFLAPCFEVGRVESGSRVVRYV